MNVDLIEVSGHSGRPRWQLGRVWSCGGTPAELGSCVERVLCESQAEGVLFWDLRLGSPDAEPIREAWTRPGDVWHAGLRLGMAGRPRILDFIHPTWMLNRDPSPDVEATSWRLSLRACLVRLEVLRRLGGPRPEFLSLAGAGLELGHRWVSRGALPRHLPWLVAGESETPVALPLADEVRFAHYRCGRLWTGWAVMRALLSRAFPFAILRAWRQVDRDPKPVEGPPLRDAVGASSPPPTDARVSVLIPTLDRYPYLRTLLAQLRRQSIEPCEILVVDQTASDRRRTDLGTEFADLPLRVLFRDVPGQSSARNAGLAAATGEYVLFLDDDDEVEPDLIALHLATLDRFAADVSSGVADEVGAGPLPDHFTLLRASDVFPANNTLIRRTILHDSGLFDLAYEHSARADGDLGMRIHLSGATMVLNPAISVLHHHAPRGGLRQHGARVITYASSRRRLLDRHLPSPSEIYLARRYFSPVQAREALWHSALGTLRLHGDRGRGLLKLLIGLLVLPDTLFRIRRSSRQAARMLRTYPRIQELPEA